MFEAIHGSAPRMIEAGEGQYANPSSILKAVEMMLRHIGRVEQAEKLAKALSVCTGPDAELQVTGHADGATCDEFAAYVLRTVKGL